MGATTDQDTANRALLERAAQASGKRIHGHKFCGDGFFTYASLHDDTIVSWRPLADDGDALRVAVKCRVFQDHIERFRQFYEEEITAGKREEEATRFAIVRTAAFQAR